MVSVKDLQFVGGSLVDLRRFPTEARREAGFQLDAVQRGFDPTDWKPLPTVGVGVREIRIHVRGQWRVIYVACFAEAVYVLHCFEKKSRKTRKEDLDLARGRYRLVR
jgi:phage-related protein